MKDVYGVLASILKELLKYNIVPYKVEFLGDIFILTFTKKDLKSTILVYLVNSTDLVITLTYHPHYNGIDNRVLKIPKSYISESFKFVAENWLKYLNI